MAQFSSEVPSGCFVSLLASFFFIHSRKFGSALHGDLWYWYSKTNDDVFCRLCLFFFTNSLHQRRSWIASEAFDVVCVTQRLWVSYISFSIFIRPHKNASFDVSKRLIFVTCDVFSSLPLQQPLVKRIQFKTEIRSKGLPVLFRISAQTGSVIRAVDGWKWICLHLGWSAFGIWVTTGNVIFWGGSRNVLGNASVLSLHLSLLLKPPACYRKVRWCWFVCFTVLLRLVKEKRCWWYWTRI